MSMEYGLLKSLLEKTSRRRMKHKKSDNFETKSVSSSLVRFAIDFKPEFVSDEVKQIAQLSLFDWFVVSLAGQTEPVSNLSLIHI